jgi:hypothetical protein
MFLRRDMCVLDTGKIKNNVIIYLQLIDHQMMGYLFNKELRSEDFLTEFPDVDNKNETIYSCFLVLP